MSRVGEAILVGLAEALAYAKGEKTGVRETVVLVEDAEQIDARQPRRRLARRTRSKGRGES